MGIKFICILYSIILHCICIILYYCIRGSKNKGQSMPEMIEGKTSDDEIVKKFKEFYGELYNSSESDDAMTIIKSKLTELINEDSLSEVNKITGKVVKMACSKMKSGKSDVYGSFTSDVLLNGPDILFDHLAAIFPSFLIYGDVTAQLQ
jgi:cyclophilin family peptidyl-prolyl cis-trans isomerase